MSKYEDGSYGSLPGIALIAKVLAGRCQMKYTRVAVGKGYIPDEETPKTMTEPAEYVMDASIVGVTNPVAGECQVTITIDSANVETGFYCTGVLLYAEDPDEGEVPYTYLALENEPEWIRPKTSLVGKLATIDIIAAVGDVDKVTAVIDPDAAATLALVQQLIEEHNADPNAHSEAIKTLYLKSSIDCLSSPKTTSSRWSAMPSRICPPVATTAIWTSPSRRRAGSRPRNPRPITTIPATSQPRA